MRLAPFLLIFGLAGCAPFPEIGADVDPDAPFPSLLPLAPILAQADRATQITPASVDDLAGRIAALNARATRVRGPVIDNATRARMRRGVTP